MDKIPAPLISLGIERKLYGDIEAELPAAPLTSVALHLSGRSTLEWGTGTRRFAARPSRGDVTIVPRGRSGSLRVRGGSSEVLKIGITDAVLEGWANAAEKPWDRNPLIDRFAVADPLILSIGLALLSEIEQDGTVDTIYRDALSNALIAHLVRRHSESEQVWASERLVHPLPASRARRAVAFMEDRLTDTIGLDDIARELGMSTSHFGAQFRRSFGRTPASYLRWLRLDRARAMLEDGQLPVAEIAWAVGYKSVSHFTQAFRAEFGQPPNVWRRYKS